MVGWSGAAPSDCSIQAPGCVTVGLMADDKYDSEGTDSLVIFRDSQRSAVDPLNQKLTSLGSVDLADDTYVAATASFLRSKLELVNGGTAVRITLGDGVVAAGPFSEVGTMKWFATSEVRDTANSPFCVNCTVYESVTPWVDPISGNTIDDHDREF